MSHYNNMMTSLLCHEYVIITSYISGKNLISVSEVIVEYCAPTLHGQWWASITGVSTWSKGQFQVHELSEGKHYSHISYYRIQQILIKARRLPRSSIAGRQNLCHTSSIAWGNRWLRMKTPSVSCNSHLIILKLNALLHQYIQMLIAMFWRVNNRINWR